LQAVPPAPSGSERPSDLVEVVTLDPSIRLDIRYATARNFLGEPVYTQARAFLQRPAAEALVRAHRQLETQGLRLADPRRVSAVVRDEDVLGRDAA
jgi:D-alanyl-D-alanine dipeptidase